MGGRHAPATGARRRRAGALAVWTGVHAGVVLAIVAGLAAVAATASYRPPSLRAPAWLVEVAAPWVTVVLLGAPVVPVLAGAALVHVREVRPGRAGSTVAVLAWLPSLAAAATATAVGRGLGWLPVAWLVAECGGAVPAAAARLRASPTRAGRSPAAAAAR